MNYLGNISVPKEVKVVVIGDASGAESAREDGSGGQ